ncbi:MAG: hypothetical protein KA765_07320 [Thermoflexales bacterium]|nr:hypothetical protein [Thermoflexales bacterium]
MNDTTNASAPSTEWTSAREEHRELRRQWRAERREARAGGAWVAGVAFIGLGVILMLQNMGAVELHNAWALFILIPAGGSFAAAYGTYRLNGGRVNSSVRGSIFSGLFFMALTAFFMFDLDLNKWWPTLLILAGVGALANAVLPD